MTKTTQASNTRKKEVILDDYVKTILKNKKRMFLEENEQQPQKNSKKFNKVRHNVNSYLFNSTLHGLNYVGDVKISYGERLFWLVAFLISCGFAIYFITNIVQTYTSNPMLISLNPLPINISDVPFPAITVCNMYLANESRTANDKSRLNFADACRIEENAHSVENCNDSTRWKQIKEIISKIYQPCKKMLHMCKWHSEENCEDFFQVVPTDEGLCCTFNMLPLKYILKNTNIANSHYYKFRDLYIKHTAFSDRTDFTFASNDYKQIKIDEWNPERGYGPHTPEDIFPLRSQGPGMHLGFRFLIDAETDRYYCGESSGGGIKMLLHNPSEIPIIQDLGFLLPVGYEIRVVFKPVIHDADGEVRHLSKRQCYFNNERYLRYFKTYSKANCRIECLANKTIEECGCVPYYYPKDNETKICHEINNPCSINVKEAMEVYESENEYSHTCNCSQSCNRLEYEKTISYGQLSNRSRTPNHYLYNKSMQYIGDNIIIADVYFETTEFSRFTKSVLYSTAELMGSVGGLLGLFLGFSILSIVEIVYHLTLKLFCNFQRSKKEQKRKKIFHVMPVKKTVQFKN